MKSTDELRALNKAHAIFEKYRLESDLFPALNDEFYLTRKENVYDIIQEIVSTVEKEHPLWNFGKTPDE